VLAAVLTTLLALAALQPAAEPAPALISQADFRKLLAAKAVQVVDTRDPTSYANGHIPGALLLSDYPPDTARARERTAARLAASKMTVVVYCACPGETTSLKTAAWLMERGVADARALVGGWVDWFNDGNPVARSR
jgi:rhodanese-related sulfurtransferase